MVIFVHKMDAAAARAVGIVRALERAGATDFFFGADLPGIGYMLNFFRWEMKEPLVGTAGRAVDHVGFEVRNLRAFCAALEAKGIKFTQPYRRLPALNNIGSAMFVVMPEMINSGRR